MKRMTVKIFLVMLLCLTASATARGQEGKYIMPPAGNFMRYRVIDGDTVYVATLPPAYVYGKGKNWRNYTRLVHNFSKTYPYALEAKRMVAEVDSTIGTDGLRRRSRDKYINTIQKQLLDTYEPVLREMTVTQGKLLIVLIGRETGMTPYEIINGYKSGTAAGFWQGIAKLFGGDLKREYDPQGADMLTEELVQKWHSGQFPEFYRSIFGQYPKVPVIKHDDTSSAQKQKADRKSRKKKKKDR